MARPKSPDGKRNALTVKVSDATLARVNAALDGRTRAVFLADALSHYLDAMAPGTAEHAQGPTQAPAADVAPAAARPPPAAVRTRAGRPAARRDGGSRQACPHPKGRRQKGGTYCPACGTGGLDPKK